ncbi:MAG TPA: STAS domain-containing protein [Planctomycetota bacterium]|nr:STAS domain-containing protein [Planctomycetota bacterium]
MSCDFLVVQRYDKIVLAEVKKERLLDPASITSLGEALIAECDRTAKISLVIDVSAVGYLSSAMIGKLVAVHKAAKLSKGRVAITGLKTPLLQMFKVTQLDKLFEFAPDAEQVIMLYKRKPL